MLFLSKPTAQQIQAQIANHRRDPFSYSEVGATQREFPAGYAVLHGRIALGRGAQVYARAQQAIREW